MALSRRPFGSTGLSVTPLGFGAGPVGDPALSDADADTLLHRVLDLGINLLDTAPSYGPSELRIGRVLATRRWEVVLSTKLGYGVAGIPNWTGACITAGLDQALKRLQVDILDIAHLHSCPRHILKQGEVIEALTRAIEAGKLRVAAYSGEGDALDFAISCGAFGSVQASLSPCDPMGGRGALPRARRLGLGVIAKRPLANAPWRFTERPTQEDFSIYWERFNTLGLNPHGMAWSDLFVRYAAFHPAADVAIVGTRSAVHLKANLAALEQGPLPAEQLRAIETTIDQVGTGWAGVI